MKLDAVIIQAGGAGQRLGGVSKADYRVRDTRLLDILFAELITVAKRSVHTVVVGPENLDVPHFATLTLEDPPFGGPLAGVGVGVEELAQLSDSAIILLATCDAPLSPRLLPRLAEDLDRDPDLAGSVPIASKGEQFPNYLQGLYRLGALRQVTISRDGSVFRAFRALSTSRVVDENAWCLDVDTPEDAVALERKMGNQ